jgi:hypothetical protein
MVCISGGVRRASATWCVVCGGRQGPLLRRQLRVGASAPRVFVGCQPSKPSRLQDAAFLWCAQATLPCTKDVRLWLPRVVSCAVVSWVISVCMLLGWHHFCGGGGECNRLRYTYRRSPSLSET